MSFVLPHHIAPKASTRPFTDVLFSDGLNQMILHKQNSKQHAHTILLDLREISNRGFNGRLEHIDESALDAPGNMITCYCESGYA